MSVAKYRTAQEVAAEKHPTTPVALYDGRRRPLEFQTSQALKTHAAVAAVMSPILASAGGYPAVISYAERQKCAYATNGKIIVAVASLALPQGEYDRRGKLLDAQPYRLNDMRGLLQPVTQVFRLDQRKTPLLNPAEMAKKIGLLPIGDSRQMPRCPAERDGWPVAIQMGESRFTMPLAQYAIMAWAIRACSLPSAQITAAVWGESYPQIQISAGDMLAVACIDRDGEESRQSPCYPESPPIVLDFSAPINPKPWKQGRKPKFPRADAAGAEHAQRTASRQAELDEMARQAQLAEQRREAENQRQREMAEQRAAREEEIRRARAQEAADDRKVLTRWARRTGQPIPHKARNWCEWRDALQAQRDFENNPTQAPVIVPDDDRSEISQAAVRAANARFCAAPNKWANEHAKCLRNASSRRQPALSLDQAA